MLLSSKNFPILSAWTSPVESRFLCVEQSLILKLEGSPPPGAKACLMKTNLPPSFKAFITSVFDKDELTEKARIR